MNTLSIASYVLALFLGSSAISIVHRLNRRYVLGYLPFYLYIIIASTVLGFLDLTGKHLVESLLSGQPPQTIHHVTFLFAFLVFPLIAVSLYLYVSSLRAILDEDVSPRFTRSYIAFSTVFFLAQVVLLRNYTDTNNAGMLKDLLLGIDILAVALPCLFYVAFLRRKRGLREKRPRFPGTFGAVYGTCWILAMASRFFFLHFANTSVEIISAVCLFFSLTLLPLLYLKNYLIKHHREFHLHPESGRDLDGLFAQFEISQRERKIILLMLEGKSNAEIEKELFISLHTVKNHIYNIYRKLKVKNRLQMSNLIRGHLRKKPPNL